jgi:hypothetical protein
VDEAVQHDGQVDVAVVVDPAVEPVEEEDGGVVVDVEEGELWWRAKRRAKRVAERIVSASKLRRC